MRLDHLLSKRRSKGCFTVESSGDDESVDVVLPRNQRSLGRDRVAYIENEMFLYESKLSTLPS